MTEINFKKRFKPAKPENWAYNRKLWVEALRSGAFKQATAHLHKADNSMCCLGVAAFLTDEQPSIYDGTYAYKGHNCYLPNAYLEFLGLQSDTGLILDDKPLADKNDNGATFKELARLIESEPAGLFFSIPEATQ